MHQKLRILLLEDIPSDAELVFLEIEKAKIAFEKLVVDTREQYNAALDDFAPDIVLSDHTLPGFNSIEALALLKKSGLIIPFILVTATVSEEFAVTMIKEGATDYILKDRLQRLPVAVLNAMENFNTEAKRKQAALEREKMTADLLRRNNDLEQFTYIISHNLRAPVANIRGLSDLLNCFNYEDSECSETLQALSASVESLDKVILDLNVILQTSNHDNEQMGVVSLPQVVDEITAEIKPAIQKHNVLFDCDFSEASELVKLKSYVRSIFHNLITNSIKYRQPGVDPIINIQTEKKEGKVLIHFSDNGKGIDLERHGAQLFGLYKRFDYSVEGKGMGLFMVKMQVEGLGGTIAVQSEPGKGTKFLMELPV